MNDKYDRGIPIIVFLVLSVAILLKSNFYSHGYLTADGCHYLSLAQNLLANNSFETNSFAGSDERGFFSVWPVGYPVLIYLMAKLSGMSVFWASKSLNIFFIALILITFRVFFKEKHCFYSLILLLAPFVEIFTYTFSEVPFIAGLLWLSITIYKIIEKDWVSVLDFLLLLLFGALVFLSRYIGLFVVGVVFLLSCYYFWKKNYRNAVALCCVSFLSFSLMILYFYNNFIRTGYATGMPRGSVPFDSFLQFISMIIRGLLAEINMITLGLGGTIASGVVFLFFLSVQVFLWLYFMKNTRVRVKDFDLHKWVPGVVFILIGLFYFIAIISARCISYFGDLDFRYLFPGTFLVLVGLVNILSDKLSPGKIKQFRKFIFVIAILSFLYVNGLSFLKNVSGGMPPSTYSTKISQIKDSVESLEYGSVIVFGDRNLAYLRTDLSIASPFYTPNFPEKESWSNFMRRIKEKYPNRKVYVMLNDSSFLGFYDDIELSKKYDKTVVQFINNNRHRLLFQLVW